MPDIRYEIYFNPWASHDFRYTLVKVEIVEAGEVSSEICRCESYGMAIANLAKYGVNVDNPAWGIKIYG